MDPSAPPLPIEMKLLTLAKAQEYLKTGHNFPVTRQTLYNWSKAGRNGHKLKTLVMHGQLYTTKGWCDDFVSSLESRR